MTPQPLRWGHQYHTVDPLKSTAFSLKITERPIEAPTLGVAVGIGTMVTVALPAETGIAIEIAAMSGEGPAIVESPHHRQAPVFQPIAQHFYLKVIAVQIVQVHQVGLQAIQLLQKRSGSPL